MVKISKFYEVHNGGIIANFNLALQDMTITGFSLRKNSKGVYWVSPPSHSDQFNNWYSNVKISEHLEIKIKELAISMLSDEKPKQVKKVKAEKVIEEDIFPF